MRAKPSIGELTRKFKPLIICAALAILAGGCTVGPNYRPPDAKVPAQ